MLDWQDDLLWSLGGFIVGFFTCWAVLSSSLRNANQNGVKDMRLIKSNVTRILVGLSILLLLVVSQVRYSQAVQCQVDYNKSVSRALNERSDATGDQLNAQLDQLISQRDFLTSLGGDRSQNAIRTQDYIKALDSNITAVRELMSARQANPLTETDCGS